MPEWLHPSSSPESADEFRFGSNADMHEMSSCTNQDQPMGNADVTVVHTPRPLIRAMIEVVQPKIGDTVYDGAAGSVGFLCEANEYMLNLAKTTEDVNSCRTQFFGKEKKGLACYWYHEFDSSWN